MTCSMYVLARERRQNSKIKCADWKRSWERRKIKLKLDVLGEELGEEKPRLCLLLLHTRTTFLFFFLSFLFTVNTS